MGNFITVLYWKKKVIAAPFLTKDKCQTLAYQHCSEWECSSAEWEYFYPTAHLSFFLMEPGRGVEFNCDDNAALRTDCSGTTIMSFVHTAGKRSLDDCSCHHWHGPAFEPLTGPQRKPDFSGCIFQFCPSSVTQVHLINRFPRKGIHS